MVKRKNFLPTLLIALFFWANVVLVAIYIPPSLLAIGYWLLAIFMALFLTLSLLFANSRRGFLLAFGVVVFLLLRCFKIAHFLNLGLLAGVLISLELYLKKR